MKKLLSIISIILAGVGISHAQVGIGTNNPQGALDLNPENGYAKWGLVLPVVPSADTVHVTTSAGDDFYPSVTTPTSAFRTVTTSETDDEGTVTTYTQLVPKEEAPAGTIVFDATKDGIRVKKTTKDAANDPNGDWCDDKLVDSTSQVKVIIDELYGGTVFKMKDVAAGVYYSIGISADDGDVYSVGQNSYYKTGRNISSGSTATWTKILAGTSSNKPVQVSAGYQHAAALMENGDVYVWGYNAYGRTGRALTSGYTLVPTKLNNFVDNGDKVIYVAAGYYNSLFLTQQGKVYIAGRGYYGMLGTGTNTSTIYSTPIDITNRFSLHTGETIKQASLSARLACAVTSEGRVFTWGENLNGSTGQGAYASATRYRAPAVISIPDTISKAVMGIGSGLAMTKDGLHLYHWGRYEALGGSVSGQPASVPTPVKIDNLTNSYDVNGITYGIFRNEGEKILDIVSPDDRTGQYLGDSHLVVTNYTVYASGQNTSNGTNEGKLGVVNDATGAAMQPIRAFMPIADHAIYEGTQFVKASIGYTHAFIITGTMKNDVDGSKTYQNYTPYGAGRNNYSQLGGGTGGWRIFTSVKR